MGFFGERSYLDDPWNVLDFVIVAFGVVDLVPGLELPGVSLLRMARVLRPLRAINRLPGLRILIKLILETLPMLGNVVLLCLFLFVVFSILAVQLLKGVMQNRCYDPNNMGGGFYEPGDIGYGVYVCSIAPDEGMLQCPPNNNYANHWYPVSTTHTLCAPSGVNPDSGVTSFDNFFTAFLTVFLVFTMEGWTEIMYTAQDAYSFWIWIFFFAIVIFGGIIAVNLFLVVITAQFCATKAADKAAQEEKQKLEAEEAQKRPDGEEPPKALEDPLTKF